MLRRALESIVSISLVAAAPVLAVADVQVTTCGASVPMNTTGFLGADLDCSASPGIGVSLGSGAALELRGFSLIGNPGATNADGVVCDGGCTVLGPGTIRDFSGNGVVSPGHLTITGATIQNIAGQGVRSVSATAAGVSISGTGTAMYSPPNDELTTSIIHVSDSTITNNGSGVTAAVVRVVNSTISNNASTAVSNTRVTIIGSHIDGNGQGVDAELISVQSSSVDFNGGGLHAYGYHPRIKVSDSTVSDNAAAGIYAWDSWSPEFRDVGSVTVSNSEVSRNGGAGIFTASASIRDGCDVSDNASTGVIAQKVAVQDSKITGNAGFGIAANGDQGTFHYYSGKCHVRASTITGNAIGGIVSADGGGIRLDHGPIVADSTVIGNDVDPDCGVTIICPDFYTVQKPRLNGTTCETSYDPQTDTDWDVCSLDPM
ncbi:MAG TPA: right-handed parallel beta-helix repeat-containing protein [Candidatus Limnocylindrales bacterium]|nr:right-handed parallel beta-helix repeat-containing protein [Candidatus Limnocylindrales bacterium]